MGSSTVPHLSVLSNYEHDSWHDFSQCQHFAQPENRLSQFTSVSETPWFGREDWNKRKPMACQMKFLPKEILKIRSFEKSLVL